MKFKYALPFALCIVSSEIYASEFREIKNRDDYIALVAGKKMSADWGWVVVEENGTLFGEAGSKSLLGRWYWKDTFWCRILFDQDGKEGKEDCQKVSSNGFVLRGLTKKGKGPMREMLISN